MLFQLAARAADFIYGDDFESTTDCIGVAAPAMAISASPGSRSTILGTTNRLLIKLRSCGYAGPVALSISGADPSWSVAMDPPALVLATNASSESALNIQIPTDGVAGSFVLQVSAQTGDGNGSATARLAVLRQVIIPFIDGTGGSDHHFPPIVLVNLGTTVRFVNYDSTSMHRVHSDNGEHGFPHEPYELAFGGEFDVTPTAPGSYGYYCHTHMFAAGSGTVIVQ
jgi:plastocyanin